MTAVGLHSIAQISAERMVNCSFAGVVLALLAWALLRLLSRQNSGTRFAVWFCALVAVAILPWLGSPRLTAPSGVSRSALVLPASWAIYVFLVWAAASGLALLRVGFGLWRLVRIRRRCSALDPARLDPLVQETWRSFSSPRKVALLVSDQVRIPAAVGFFRPAVVLPAWSVEELGSSRLNAVLLHELAHVQRWDDWTNLAQKTLRALLIFHPAVWWIDRQLSLEREMACDDVVLESADPQSYAQCLVAVAERSLLQRGYAMAQAAVSRMRQTSQRIRRILDHTRPAATTIWKPAPIVLAALSVIGVASWSRTRALVAFQKEPGPVAAFSAPASSATLLSPSTRSAGPARERSTIATDLALPRPRVHLVKDTALGLSTAGAQRLAPAIAKPHAARSASLRRVQLARTSDPSSRTAFLVVLRPTMDRGYGPARWVVCVWRVRVLQFNVIGLDPAEVSGGISLISI